MWKFFSHLEERKQSCQKYDMCKSNKIKDARYTHGLFDDPRLLQQIFGYLGPDHGSRRRELHLQVLPKATGVVIDRCAGISKGLHKGVHLQYLFTQRPIVCLATKTHFFNELWFDWLMKCMQYSAETMSENTIKEMTTRLYLSQEGQMLNN